MAFAFDTLGYAKKLRDAGVTADQAEAHAEAARDFVMHELVTRYDLQGLKDELETVRRELDAKIGSKTDVLGNAIEALRREVEAKIDTLSLRLTVRMGVMLAAGLSILAAVLKLHS